MSIDVTSTAMSTAAAPVSGNKVSQAGTDKTSSDSTFKEEMGKVSSTQKEENKTDAAKAEITKSSNKDDKKTFNNKENKVDTKSAVSEDLPTQNVNENQQYNAGISLNVQNAFADANTMLQSDIAQMIENSVNVGQNSMNLLWSLNFGADKSMNLSFNEADAQFFINLTQSNDISAKNMMSQAQELLNAGVNSKQVAQNFKVSQALLNALAESRQNNQPLRIDFDKNISVILRVGRDGAIAANFIPGDKAVEQYLRTNIEALKATFEEQDLPYSELAYSNSSKQQNQRRRNQQQGEE